MATLLPNAAAATLLSRALRCAAISALMSALPAIPFYTGRQKTAETGGRIDRFKQRFGSRSLK
jgi:hypothetical protein